MGRGELPDDRLIDLLHLQPKLVVTLNYLLQRDATVSAERVNPGSIARLHEGSEDDGLGFRH